MNRTYRLLLLIAAALPLCSCVDPYYAGVYPPPPGPVGAGPVYGAPPVAVVAPRPVYVAPPPVYVAPRPVVVAPRPYYRGGYYPGGYYRPGYRRW